MRQLVLAGAAALLAAGLHAQASAIQQPQSCNQSPFPDVPFSSQSCRWIQQAGKDGIMTTCDGSSFCPANAVTREQLAVHIERALRGRVWGQGRPGTTYYGTGGAASGLCSSGGSVAAGLSLHTASWDGAAAACPMGTWVCTLDELVTCNTARPDSSGCDSRDCAGTCLDQSSNNHIGWVADPYFWDNLWGGTFGRTFLEGGAQGAFARCASLPVWCCSAMDS